MQKLFLIFIITALSTATCFGSPILEIPQTPTAPPALGKKPPATKAFGCQRYFLYQGKLQECDSNLYPDAEKLRSLFEDVPKATTELNLYQTNRKSIKKLAFIGTLGLALAGLGSFIAGQYFEGLEKVVFRNYFAIPGLIITSGSLVYGFVILSLNEAHLSNAVHHYNQAHPENPIELQFSTRFHF